MALGLEKSQVAGRKSRVDLPRAKVEFSSKKRAQRAKKVAAKREKVSFSPSLVSLFVFPPSEFRAPLLEKEREKEILILNVEAQF